MSSWAAGNVSSPSALLVQVLRKGDAVLAQEPPC